MINYLSKPFKWFFKLEAASGLVLLIAAIFALIVSNSNLSQLYFLTLEKYLFIGINEFYWNILKTQKNGALACWWLEWILGFEDICKKDNKKYSGARRSNMPVESNFQKDIIWIIWDSIIYNSNNKKNKLLDKIIHSLLDLFCLKYSVSCKKKRKGIIYFAISLIVENINLDISLFSKNQEYIDIITDKINLIYKDIKNNEISPGTDYLFENIKNTNIEKSIKKLEIFKKYDNLTN